MRKLLILLMLAFLFQSISAQSDLVNLFSTEKQFAQTAFEKNMKTAFLEFLADDGIIFDPNPMNGKEVWKKRTENRSLLAWNPEFADVSTNGILGYTTGPWEYRPNGKNDVPTAFGHYVTIWQKQADGKFKFVLDIGINHERVSLDVNFVFPTDVNKELNPKKISAADTSMRFFETAEKSSFEKAYKMMAADDIRLYREGKKPFLGKKAALDEVKKEINKVRFARRSIFTSAGDLAYISNSYAFSDTTGKEIEKGNYLQIWKFRKGDWKIVLDLFSRIPNEKK